MKKISFFFLQLLFLTGLFAGAGLSSAEPSTQLIPRRLLFGNPEKASPRLSPDGKQLAFLAPDENNVLNVWLREDKTVPKEKLITKDKKRGIRSFLWQYDLEHILYLQDKEGDENWHIYQTHIDTGTTKDLTPYEGVCASILDYDHRFPNRMLILMNLRNPALFDVYTLNLDTGKTDLETENDREVFEWVVDRNLEVRMALSYNQDGSTLIRIRENKTSPWKEFMTLDPHETGGSVVGFTPDNRSIYLISSVDGDTARLLEVDAATGKRKLIIEDKQFDLSTVMLDPVDHHLEAVGFDKEKFEWIILDSKLKGDFDHLSEKLKGSFKIASKDIANQHWIVASFSDLRPIHYYSYHRQTKTLTFLFSTQPEMERYALSSMVPVSFAARDGMKLFSYLTLPAGLPGKKLPLILLVHGGPWARDSWGLNSTVQWFANRGYAVLQINFRGSTGYGKNYLNAGNRQWADKMRTDLLDGKDWAVQNEFADPKKVAIYGGSYGGYATLAALAFTPDEFCCGVDIVGPSNITTLLQTIPPYWLPLKAQTDRRLGDLEKDAEFLREISPLHKAHLIKRPLLIAQGANDPRVKQAESDQIVQAMRQNQLPVEYLLFPDEGHGFARPENRLKFMAAAEAFLTKYLDGRNEPPSQDENWESLRK
ncbi:MAG: S9 family peptidase [Candidatus Protochlamydia sp.]|nr:S9 family peptidase [Candidatus Protochlamydia sp.]